MESRKFKRTGNVEAAYKDMAKYSSLNADLMRIIGAIRSTVIRLGPTLHSRD